MACTEDPVPQQMQGVSSRTAVHKQLYSFVCFFLKMNKNKRKMEKAKQQQQNPRNQLVLLIQVFEN